MAPAGNKSLRLSQASHVKYDYLPTYLHAVLIEQIYVIFLSLYILKKLSFCVK